MFGISEEYSKTLLKWIKGYLWQVEDLEWEKDSFNYSETKLMPITGSVAAFSDVRPFSMKIGNLDGITAIVRMNRTSTGSLVFRFIIRIIMSADAHYSIPRLIGYYKFRDLDDELGIVKTTKTFWES